MTFLGKQPLKTLPIKSETLALLSEAAKQMIPQAVSLCIEALHCSVSQSLCLVRSLSQDSEEHKSEEQLASQK